MTIDLPRDDAFIGNVPVQWWYWTGHLVGQQSKKHYGFELVFFAIAKLVEPLVWTPAVMMAQGAIADLATKRHMSTAYEGPSLWQSSQNGFDIIAKHLNAKGGGGLDHLAFTVGTMDVALNADQVKDPIMHYGGDRHDYSFGGYTYYYSRPLMDVTGVITTNPVGERPTTEAVRGIAWFDRQWGNLAEAVTVGWNWFSIQLDSDVQIMLTFFQGTTEETFGSITDASGTTTPLTGCDFDIKALEFWISPTTKQSYPSLWHITGRDFDLEVTPKLADQELIGGMLRPTYWEGTCAVTGTCFGKAVTGDSYVEIEPGWTIGH